MRLRARSSRLVIFSLLLLLPFAASRYRTDPCLDGEQEIEVENLKLPRKYANLTPPWKRTDGKYAKVIRSDGLSYQWSWVKALLIKGFFRTVEDVINLLDNNNCLFVPVGSFVRNIVLSQKTVYISGEVSCDLHMLYEKCVSFLGPFACGLYPNPEGGIRLEIGDRGVNRSISAAYAEPLVLYEWRSVLGAPQNKARFTIDTLALYDDGAGDVFAIDPLGDGYEHVCEKKIVPVISDWKQWADGQEMKVISFYDIRDEGFSSHSATFRKFINDNIKEADKRVSQQFYCEHVLKGVANLEGSTPLCHTQYPGTEASEKIKHMRTVMINEMGLGWNSTVGKAADDLEAVYCTPRQFYEIRNRLYHKIPSKYDDIQRPPERPKIIQEGRPMINDSAQVHARPILAMSDEVPQLPAEYPSLPRAQPNEKGVFVEPPEIQGGAGGDPTALMGTQEVMEPSEDLEPSEDPSEDPEVPNSVTRIETGEPVEKEVAVNDFSHHNSIGDNLPVMKFDKVEEGELSDVAAALEISTSSAVSWILNPLLIILAFYFYLL